MRYQITNHLTPAQLYSALPERYQVKLATIPLHSPEYTLLRFDTSEHQITSSRLVGKALAAVADADPILAVAFGLTSEALELLSAKGVTVLVISEFHWTDESYSRVRQA